MPKKKKDLSPMEKLTQGYEKFIKGKELNPKGKEVFNKVIKNTTKKKD